MTMSLLHPMATGIIRGMGTIAVLRELRESDNISSESGQLLAKRLIQTSAIMRRTTNRSVSIQIADAGIGESRHS